MIMQRFNEERGVAAITVLMVTLTLALAGGVVAFTATSELEIGARERRAEDAFVSAEAGLDTAASYFARNPTFTGGATEVCLNNTLVADAVEYVHPTLGVPCGVDITSPSNGQLVYPVTGKPFIDYLVLSRAQEGRAVTRTLAANYHLVSPEIPFGMFVNGNVDLNGTPNLLRESLLVNGVVTSREKLTHDWNGNNQFDDPDLGWPFHKNRITSNPVPDMCFDASTGQDVGCAGVYSNFQIFQKNQQKASDEIHASSPSPYPRDRDSHQAVIINNVAQPVVTLPTTDVLDAMDTLKTLAKSQGLYYDYRDGSGGSTVIQPADIGATTKTFPKNVVIYIDADAGDTIGWKVSLIPNSPSSDIKTAAGVGSLSGIIVVRGGILRMESGDVWSGALFAPENEFRILGDVNCTCTIYAQGFSAQGGGSTIQLTPEWFQNLPGGLFKITRQAFLECEPFQPSAICPP
jgi:hypothetical protein